MYVTINKEWFLENKEKLESKDTEGSYVIDIETIDGGELNEYDKGELHLSESNENVYVALDYTPSTDIIIDLVEEAFDDIKGDALKRIIELTVKKLNKFKSFIETIQGL